MRGASASRAAALKTLESARPGKLIDGRQDDGRSHNRTGQAAAPRLVDTGSKTGDPIRDAGMRAEQIDLHFLGFHSEMVLSGAEQEIFAIDQAKKRRAAAEREFDRGAPLW